MGWLDGVSEVGSTHHHHHSSGSKHRHSSPKRHSSGSIFGTGDHKHNSSRSSFFGFPNRSSSHYKRSPRAGYLNRVYHKLRRLLRDLIYYMKKHPMKVFALVIMPLITGGALTGLLRSFGIRLPVGIERMFGAAAAGYGGGGTAERIVRDGRGGMQFERTRYEGKGAGGMLDNLGGLAGVVGGAGSAINLAKMFM